MSEKQLLECYDSFGCCGRILIPAHFEWPLITTKKLELRRDLQKQGYSGALAGDCFTARYLGHFLARVSESLFIPDHHT